MLRRILYIICVLSLVACYDDFDQVQGEGEKLELTRNCTIENLHSIFAADGYLDVTSDIVIAGSVTANDEGGNFYKTFVIEESGYGVEILEGLTDSYSRHQIGAVIYVSLKGLRLARSRGVLQVGLATYQGSSYDIDYLGHEAIVDAHIVNSGYVSVVEPRVVGIDELTGAEGADFVEKMCGSLVTIEGVRYLPDEDDDSSAVELWGGYHCFVDVGYDEESSDDDPIELWCYVSDYSDFSLCEIPYEECSLTGIMQSGVVSGSTVSKPILKMRDLNDCQ